MSARWSAARCGIGVVFAVSACTVAWDFDPLQDGVCPEGTKACDSECVPTNDPAIGCARPGCAACTLLNAVAICNASHECVVSVCRDRFEDCDGDRLDCEIDTGFDPDNCGACGNECSPPPNGTAACSAGFCTLGGCLPSFRSCDGDDANGCEVDILDSNLHCGTCNAPCSGAEVCVSGSCEMR